MATSINNPRFPHTCRIYRPAAPSSFDTAGDTTCVLHTGPCRISTSTNIRTFNTGSSSTGKIDTADYRVSIPGIIPGIRKGDLVDVTHLTGTETAMRIVDFASTSLSSGATELLCNTSSN